MKVPSKSQVEFYLDLCTQLIAGDPLCIASSKSLRKDIEVLRHRCQFEGLSFLTKTLPKLGKALDLGLVTSVFSLPVEFKSSHSSSKWPAFMQVYFKTVFDERGCLREDANPDAVKHLRQVLFFAYKLELAYTDSEKDSVIQKFITTDESLELPTDEESTSILNVGTFIVQDIFEDFDPKDIIPRHGPGAVATGEHLEEKWEFSRLYSGIHQSYPYYDYFIVGRGKELIDRKAWYMSLQRLDQGRAKVVLVPKDSRGPRLISAEPLEYQWIQQGLGRKIVSHLESFWMTRGQINFTHQEVNQRLALSSSLTGEYATLDLSDASDRVSLALVQYMFKRTPVLLRCLEACRSAATLLPDGREITLKKFAPMGSALCFPVEALIFWVIMVAAVSRFHKIAPRLVGKRIFVYGDDLIVPVEWAALCMQTLERYSLKVNTQKCCITGSFRESCGIDAFKGVVVTPIRLRTQWSGRKTDGSAYVSYVELANKLSSAYPTCSNLIWERLEAVYGVIPHGTALASFPCKVVTCPINAEEYNSLHFRARYSRRYQRKEFLLTYLSSVKRESKLDSWTRLLRNLVSGKVDDPSSVVVPRSTSIKRGWRAVY